MWAVLLITHCHCRSPSALSPLQDLYQILPYTQCFCQWLYGKSPRKEAGCSSNTQGLHRDKTSLTHPSTIVFFFILFFLKYKKINKNYCSQEQKNYCTILLSQITASISLLGKSNCMARNGYLRKKILNFQEVAGFHQGVCFALLCFSLHRHAYNIFLMAKQSLIWQYFQTCNFVKWIIHHFFETHKWKSDDVTILNNIKVLRIIYTIFFLKIA